jgi:hypothetical protein
MAAKLSFAKAPCQQLYKLEPTVSIYDLEAPCRQRGVGETNQETVATVRARHIIIGLRRC